MKLIFTIMMLFCFRSLVATPACEKCDIQKVKIVNENLESLTFQMAIIILNTLSGVMRRFLKFLKNHRMFFFKLLRKEK
jgi:hypothetical protein